LGGQGTNGIQGVWTYSGDPNKSAKDQTRFLLGDTDKSDPLLSDQEIIWALGVYNNTPMNAAIRLCEAIIAKFSRYVSESVGPVKIEFQQKVENYRAQLRDLRSRLAMEAAIPYAGGISVSDKIANAMNSDRVRPDFQKHMMENWMIAPWVTNDEYYMWLAFEG
jgi:hypothetical protein